jgi:hypothetical protein
MSGAQYGFETGIVSLGERYKRHCVVDGKDCTGATWGLSPHEERVIQDAMFSRRIYRWADIRMKFEKSYME